jgi:hypothetical protein
VVTAKLDSVDDIIAGLGKVDISREGSGVEAPDEGVQYSQNYSIGCTSSCGGTCYQYRESSKSRVPFVYTGTYD